MKKMNVLLATLSLAVTMLTPVTSSAIEFKGGVNKMEVSKKYTSYYTLNIPETVQELDKEKGLSVGATGFLNYNEKLVVSVKSKNDWKIKDKNYEGNTNDISYTMSVDGKKITKEDGNIFEVSYADEGQTKSVVMELDTIGKAVYAGTYSDILTFEVESAVVDETLQTTATEPELPASATTVADT